MKEWKYSPRVHLRAGAATVAVLLLAVVFCIYPLLFVVTCGIASVFVCIALLYVGSLHLFNDQQGQEE